MAKRFTDTTKWNDDWFFNLSNEQKLAWIYILDTCDHAGVWKKNIKLLNFHTGSCFVEDNLKQVFSGKFIEIKDKWFIPNFIKFQYGNTFLTSKNNAVVSARELLLDLRFIQQDINGTLTLIKGLPNPTLTLKEQEQEQDKDKDMVKSINKDEDKIKNKNEEISKITDIDKNKIKNTFTYKKQEQINKLNKEELDQYLIQLDIYEKYNENDTRRNKEIHS